MPPKTKPERPASVASQQQKIDKAAAVLVRLLERAAAEQQHGTFGVRVTVHDGHIRNTKEITEVSHN